MFTRPPIREHPRSQALQDSSVRIGLLVGAGLAAALSGWVYLANRVPIFDSISVERNVAAAAILGFLAFMPVMRFFREPGNLLVSSLIAWSMLTLTYSALSMFFWALRDWYSTFQIFMLGAVIYLITATVSWIGTCIWKARSAHLSSPRHPRELNHARD
jgi:hypothetical protein